jgi:hypothetical protein
MARSSYIYVVQDSRRAILATFTVKHEMVTWLQREWAAREPGPTRSDLEVWRHSDGLRRDEPVWMGSARKVAGLA